MKLNDIMAVFICERGRQLIPQDHLMNLFHCGSYPDAPSMAQALLGKSDEDEELGRLAGVFFVVVSS